MAEPSLEAGQELDCTGQAPCEEDGRRSWCSRAFLQSSVPIPLRRLLRGEHSVPGRGVITLECYLQSGAFTAT